MAILRVVHDDNYSVMSNEVLRDKNLSFKAKGLLCYMLSCKDDWDFNIEGIAAMGSDGYKAVRTGLIELERAGYLKREFIRDGNRIGDTQYTIFEHSQKIDYYYERTGK